MTLNELNWPSPQSSPTGRGRGIAALTILLFLLPPGEGQDEGLLSVHGQFNQLEVAGFSLFRFRSPLLTESLSISFPPVTEMFHFTGCRDVPAIDSQELERMLLRSGYPIRTFTGQSVFAALRDLSPLTTSFIAYWHQGIHDALFVA